MTVRLYPELLAFIVPLVAVNEPIPTVPVNDGFEIGAFRPMALVTVVAKSGSLPNAAASSFRVSNVVGAAFTRFEIAVFTNAVDAICVVLVPAVAVGTVGVPVSAAFVNMVALDSLVTLPNPTMLADIPVTVPVNVGLANIVALDSLVTLPKPTMLAVTPVTVPVKAGLLNIVVLLSLVTLPNPTIAAVTPVTVPVKAGLLNINVLISPTVVLLLVGPGPTTGNSIVPVTDDKLGNCENFFDIKLS